MSALDEIADRNADRAREQQRRQRLVGHILAQLFRSSAKGFLRGAESLVGLAAQLLFRIACRAADCILRLAADVPRRAFEFVFVDHRSSFHSFSRLFGFLSPFFEIAIPLNGRRRLRCRAAYEMARSDAEYYRARVKLSCERVKPSLHHLHRLMSAPPWDHASLTT